jgi:hypothetical protein
VAKLSVERTTMAILPWLSSPRLLIAITLIPEITPGCLDHGTGEVGAPSAPGCVAEDVHDEGLGDDLHAGARKPMAATAFCIARHEQHLPSGRNPCRIGDLAAVEPRRPMSVTAGRSVAEPDAQAGRPSLASAPVPQLLQQIYDEQAHERLVITTSTVGRGLCDPRHRPHPRHAGTSCT